MVLNRQEQQNEEEEHETPVKNVRNADDQKIEKYNKLIFSNYFPKFSDKNLYSQDLEFSASFYENFKFVGKLQVSMKASSLSQEAEMDYKAK